MNACRHAVAVFASTSCLALGSPADAQRRPDQAPRAAAMPASGPARGASYTVDPTHTFVMYEIVHYGTTTNRGRFGTRAGSIRIGPDGRTGSVDITLDIGSVSTGVDLLDRHVRSKDFFDVADYPTGRFVADRVVFSGDQVTEVPGWGLDVGFEDEVTPSVQVEAVKAQ